jgi:hypothetical protein
MVPMGFLLLITAVLALEHIVLIHPQYRLPRVPPRIPEQTNIYIYI